MISNEIRKHFKDVIESESIFNFLTIKLIQNLMMYYMSQHIGCQLICENYFLIRI